VSVAARVDRLEGALSPVAATILWLQEAHAFGTLEAYSAWLATQPLPTAPLERVPELARRGALEATKGQPRKVVLKASRQAVRDAIFLVELVITLTREARETLKTEGLRFAAFHWMLRALVTEMAAGPESPLRKRQGSPIDDLSGLCRAIRVLLARLKVEGEARRELERRYLGGHGVLYPADAEDWEQLITSLEALSEMGEDVLGERVKRRSGRRAACSSEPDDASSASSTRAAVNAEVRYLEDTARAHALRLLGHGDAAAVIVARRLVAAVST
jgi:hypothetical protein